MRLVNPGNGMVIAESVELANTFFKRLKGLMFRKALSVDGGLYLHPCKSIHTFFMKFPIDVLYIDENGKIVGIQEKLVPGKLGKNVPKAASVIELASGSIRKNRLNLGQIVKLLNY